MGKELGIKITVAEKDQVLTAADVDGVWITGYGTGGNCGIVGPCGVRGAGIIDIGPDLSRL
jgi:hypothetical protein